MSTLTPYWLAAGIVFAIGFVALIISAHMLRKVLAVGLMTNGAFIFLVATAARSPSPDPLTHALVLTGLVISVSATALALVMMRRLHEEWGVRTLREESEP